MKKIDLHIHTIPTISDAHFIFSIESFKRYVQEAKLDAVAITNHDIFNIEQYKKIKDSLNIKVFPGIEVNLEKGHILIISEDSNVEDFQKKCNLVSQRIQTISDYITVDDLIAIFIDLNDYLIIPHYDKKPSIPSKIIDRLKKYISAGEVDSPKKFLRNIKDNSKLTPVIFSDTRIREGENRLPTRQTYIDCGDITLSAIKLCLKDKKKVALSENDGNRLWQVFDNGQMLSTGLNILLGERSSGKSYTLNKIYNNDAFEKVKYIEQFSLVQQNEVNYEKEFKNEIEKKRSIFVDEYLSDFKSILDDVMNIDLEADNRKIEKYISSLLKSAEEVDRNDAFSNTALFSETKFSIGQFNTLKELIESVRQVIENIEYKHIIEKHINIDHLKIIACELIETLWGKILDSNKKTLINELISDIKSNLQVRTSATHVEDVDLYETTLNFLRIKKFNEITTNLKFEAVISEENIQGFKIEAKKEPFNGAGEIRAVNGTSTAFGEAYKEYGNPYKYLQQLLSNPTLTRSELYKLFVKISYKILNKDGFEVSGGERSEFRLLQEIADAQNFDLLLIDEPESSFDNLFLQSNVNQILKKLSEFMPIVVVTHNSTVGASIEADYILYTKKEVKSGKIDYQIYSGYPTDKKLKSTDSKLINTHDILLNSLEAGFETYTHRRNKYEAVKN